jgi:diguanylate cyclase (GGDEF)-like protein
LLQENAHVSLRSKMLAMTTIPAVVLFFAVFYAVAAQREAARTNAQVDRTNEVLHLLAKVQDDLSVAEADVGGHLLTGREGFREGYREAVATLRQDLSKIDAILEDPLQRNRLERLRELVEERLATFRAVQDLGRARTPEDQARLETWLLHGQTISDSLRALTVQMEATGEGVVATRIAARDDAFDRSYQVEVFAMPAAVAAAMLLMVGFTAGIVRRISHMRNNAKRLEQGIPLHAPDRSADELGSLSRALARTGSRVSELQGELRKLATVDELTGLSNRRGFFSLANQQLLLAARTRSAVALLFIDTDGLKRVNDELGHSVGDALLVEAADVIRETIRASDLAARLGGDEFCVLLMGDPELDAQRVVQRMRETEATHNARPGRAFRVCLSIGLSSLPPGRTVTLEELIDAADEGMYADKRGKRDAQGPRPSEAVVTSSLASGPLLGHRQARSGEPASVPDAMRASSRPASFDEDA